MLHDDSFEYIISLKNIFTAWKKFSRGKRSKADIQKFEHKLEDNIFTLHRELATGKYQSSSYSQFRITDPKLRLISKAPVQDRLLHQVIYQVLYPVFDPTFIFDSYSCRDDKGTHKAFNRLVTFTRQVSRNYTHPCWAIKMDIRRFFDSVDHKVLLQQLEQRIADQKLLKLLTDIIQSFEFSTGKGMPLGNLTSQLFANIYMDPLDKFVKHHLIAQFYLRYADDFMILSSDPDELMGYLVEINTFLKTKLGLTIHPNKIILRKLSQGIDFVGYVARPYYQLPRRKTVRRILKKVSRSTKADLEEALPSYLGYLGHVASYKTKEQLLTASRS